MTKIGFKLTISPFVYQIFTAPLMEPLRVDYPALVGICLFLRQFHVENVPPLFAIRESCKCLLQSPVRLCNAAAT
jgi:hypothetical protein